MHVHQSLFKGERNAFFDERDEYHLSRARAELHRRAAAPRARDHARHEPVGELLQAPRARLRGAGLPLLGAPQPLRPDPRARVQAAARRTRRASSTARPTPPATRTWRSRRCSPPGLEGIEKEYPCPDPVEENVFEMSEEERKERGIEHLPGSLCGGDRGRGGQRPPARGARRPPLREPAHATRRSSGTNFRRQVTDYELQRYLPLL